MKDFKSLRIIFMGTPEFAVASLHKLVNEGCNIVAVITAPDKAAGRGMQMCCKKICCRAQHKSTSARKIKRPRFFK